MKPRLFNIAIRKGAGLAGFLILCVALSQSGFVTASKSSEIILVEDGRATSTIVVGEDDGFSGALAMGLDGGSQRLPQGNLGVAAQALADQLSEMARIGDPRWQIRVVEEIGAARTPYRILLGSAAIEEYGLHEEAATLSYWSYIYRTEGNDLLIFGSSSKGAANGVYGFLQDELGVRWFGPGELFRILPEDETIRVADLDHREDPDFTGRFSMSHLLDQPQGIWANRMRVAEPGRGEALPFYFRPHTLGSIFPVEEYGDRPELYAIKNGQRLLDPNRFGLCYSNPEVVELTVDYIRDYFKEGGHRHTFPLGMNDSLAFCECEECTKIQPERYFRGLRVASDMWWHYVNEVARRVGAEFPDRYIGTGASKDIVLPPLGDTEENVFVVLLNDVSEFYDPEFRDQEEEFVSAWAEKDSKLGMYYYTGLAKLVPAYFPRTLAGVLKERKDQNFVVLYTEAHPGWPWTGPMHYVQARLWWDIDLDPDQLLEEYFTLLYGPAAPYMSRLFDLFEEIHMRERPSGGVLYEHYNFAQFRPYTAEDLAEMRELIAAAHGALAELSIGRSGRENMESQRLAYVTSGLRLFEEMLEGVVLARELNEMEITNDDEAVLEALWQVERLNELVGRHEQVYREAIITDLTHSNRFLNDTATPVRNGWKRFLSEGATRVLVELHGRRQNLSPRMAGRIEEMIANHTRDPYRRALFMIQSGTASLGGNLVPNPDFEESEGLHPEVPDRFNWTPLEADHWLSWQMVPGQGTIGLSSARPTTGTRSAVLEGIGSGCLVAWIPNVRDGEMFYVAADAFIDAGRDDRTVARVILRWQDADLRWITGTDARIQQETQTLDEWVRLEAITEPPENAAVAVILLYVDDLQEGGSVYFDNVSLRTVQIQ